MSYEEVVFNRSYINIILLNRSIPSYNFDKEDNEDEGKYMRKTQKDSDYKHENDLFESLM